MNERLTLSLADGLYEVEPVGEIDNQLYIIYKDDRPIGTLGINENGEWESTCDTPAELVRQLGLLIEPDFQ